jgi:hypothetical protein
MPIICRKCGGEHLTIKCGTEKKEVIQESTTNINKSRPSSKDSRHSSKDSRPNSKDSRPNSKDGSERNNYNSKDFKNKNVRKVSKPNYDKYTVLISNLPNDIELINIQYMMMDWGKIGNINLKYSEEKGKMCFIDFYNKDHSDYFIKAIHKTPVGFNIVDVIYIK